MGALAVLFVGVSCCLWGPTGMWFEFTCKSRIHVGMALAEVKSILGPGKECSWPPFGGPGNRPLVQGERFFMWHNKSTKFFIGLRDGKVCDTWFWTPSL
jgi:hypothetical protein